MPPNVFVFTPNPTQSNQNDYPNGFVTNTPATNVFNMTTTGGKNITRKKSKTRKRLKRKNNKNIRKKSKTRKHPKRKNNKKTRKNKCVK